MPSQPVWLYQGGIHFVIIYYYLKVYICVKTGISTILKSYLKREVWYKQPKLISSLNFSKNIDLFQKVKNLLRRNLLKQLTQ